MSMTETKQHAWHHMTHTPVEVLGEWTDGEGLPAYIDAGEEREGVSCFNCGEPYSEEQAGQPCEAEEDATGVGD